MYKKQITILIKSTLKKLGYENTPFSVEYPENAEFGDYSTNVAMILSKSLSRPPLEIAQEISAEIKSNLFSKVEAVQPGFINFYLSKEALAKGLEEGLPFPSKKKNYLIEHTSPNPNKAMHLGHLRNNVLGMALANIWEELGFKVVRDCIDNDRGIAIAKLMWGYLKFGRKDGRTDKTDMSYWTDNKNEWWGVDEIKERPDRFVDSLYVKACEDFEGYEESEKAVRALVQDWEKGDKQVLALWETVLEFSHRGQALTLERLKSRWDKVWHESDHYKEGKRFVVEGLKKGIFTKLDDGAIISNLKDFNLSDTVLIKKDGTSLYITQDLALTLLKKKEFKPDKMFWVIGPEQSLALKQLFAVCEQLGIGKREEFTHIPYGYMSLKGVGKMSSRLGNVLYIDDLLDEVKRKILKINLELSDPDAEKIALGAVKYGILKVGRTSDISFDIDSSISTEGDSGPYLMYTYARCKSVLVGSESKQYVLCVPSVLSDLSPEELNVLRHLFKFSEVLEEVGESLNPNLLCLFLFELSQKYNSFYAKCPILDASTKESKDFRLALTLKASQVLNKGLGLLGVETLEKM